MTQALLSPGQSYNEQDLSYYVPALSTTHVGMIGTATKGPLNTPTLCTSVQDFENKFGPAHPDHLATYSARLYFTQGRLLTFVRVAKQGTGSDVAASASESFVSGTIATITGTARSETGNTVNTGSFLAAINGVDIDVSVEAGTFFVGDMVDVLNGDPTFSAQAVASSNSSRQLTITSRIRGARSSIVIDSSVGENDEFGFTSDVDESGDDGASTSGITITASSPGIWGNNISVQLSDGSTPGTFKLDVRVGNLVVESYNNLVDSTYVLEEYSRASRAANAVNENSDYISVSEGSTGGIPITTDGFESLTGGNDGADADDEDYGTLEGSTWGLDLFRDKESITINLLSVPGESRSGIVSSLISLANDRGDILAVIDPPFGLSRDEVIDYHNGDEVTGHDYKDPDAELSESVDGELLNSSNATIYWPWVQIYDPQRNQNVWTPPSAHAILAMVRTDFAEGEHFAPAGPVRGLLPHAIDIEVNPNQGDRDLLYDTQGAGNAINPIIRSSTYGIVIWGQRTLQRTPSALDRINVRRLMIRIRQLIDIAGAGLIFGQADLTTAITFVRTVGPALDALVQRRALRDYRIIADGSNNTAESLARNEVRASIFVSPIRTAEFFHLNTVVTEQGVSFEDIAF